MMEDHQFVNDSGGAGSDVDDDLDDDLGQRRSSFDIHDNRNGALGASREIFTADYGLESTSESSEELPDASLSTIEAANAAKASIVKYYNNLFSSIYEREQRRLRYEQKMDQIGLADAEKEERRKKLDLIETQFLRARRIRLKKDTFQTISVIGRGSFGEVRLVQMKGTKKLFAMKKLKKSKMIARNQVEHVKKERDALADLNDFYKQNAWVVRLYYSFQDALHLYLIMEYVPGGDLMTQLMKYEKFSEKVAKFYLAEIVMAVGSIHRFNYIHRDIKPDNILLDKKGHIKLSDFGLCTAITTEEKVREMQNKYATLKRTTSTADLTDAGEPVGSTSSTSLRTDFLAPPQPAHSMSRSGSSTSLTDTDDGSLSSSRFHSWKKKRRELAFSEVGTPDYMAPEVLDPDGNGYGKECDWWSVGVILFEMLAGFPAFYSSSESGSSATYRKILNWKETLEQVLNEITISSEARDLICKFLTERENRIGTRGGVEEIQRHPFFAGIDWDNIRNAQAPIIPHLEHATDTSNFPVEDEDEIELSEEEEEEKELESRYPLYRGRRLRQTDIPFIGFTYKNLAAVPQLIRSPAKGGSQSSH